MSLTDHLLTSYVKSITHVDMRRMKLVVGTENRRVHPSMSRHHHVRLWQPRSAVQGAIKRAIAQVRGEATDT